MRQQRLSSDTYRLSDDDDVSNADTLDQAVARNIDIDSAMIDQELTGISEPLSVSFLFLIYFLIIRQMKRACRCCILLLFTG